MAVHHDRNAQVGDVAHLGHHVLHGPVQLVVGEAAFLGAAFWAVDLVAFFAAHHDALGIEYLPFGFDFLEVQGGADLDDGPPRTEGAVQHALGLFRQVTLHFLAQFQLGLAAAHVRVLHAAGQFAARGVMDAHVVHVEIGHRRGHQGLDAADLVLAQMDAAPQLQGDAGGGPGLSLVEDGGFGQDQMDSGGLDGGQRFDGARQLSFEGALVIHVLDELGPAEGFPVEDLEARHAVGDQPLAVHLDAQAVDQVLGNQDGGASVLEFEIHTHLAQFVHGGAGVLGAEVGEQHPHVFLLDPEGEDGDAQDGGHPHGTQHDLLVEAQLAQLPLHGVDELLDPVHAITSDPSTVS